MERKNGAEGIVYAEKNGVRYYLLLHRVLNWRGWEFPKGGIDEGETPEETELREIREETGLKTLGITKKLSNKKEWKTKDCAYSYDIFIVKADIDEHIQLQSQIIEHDSFKWANSKEAQKMLTHDNSKKMFNQALKELEKC